MPVYHHPLYEHLGYRRGLCPVTERAYEGLLTLPLFAAMTDADVADVVAALAKVLGRHQL
jgi:dTDP-4-amino-4,6-dideoxygalactose transaminase